MLPRALRFPSCGLIVAGLAIFIVGPFTVGASPASALPSAEDLLEASIAYHDPEGRFLTLAHRLWFLETRPQGPDRRSEVLVDVPGERFEMVRAGEHEVAGVLGPGQCAMTLDGRAEVSAEEREEHRLSCERLKLMRNYYTYLWGLPMKLRDPGTQLGRVSETTFAEREVYDLRVTYSQEVGKDIWYFYFDRQTYALVGYRFYHDEAKNDGEVILLDGEVVAEGLRLPKRRTWITHADDRTLGTDILLAIAGPAPERLDNGFNAEVFRRWIDMRLGTGEAPVYWYSVGEVYTYPSGELLLRMEGFDTGRPWRREGEKDVVYQLSRKTYVYRHPESGEILRHWPPEAAAGEGRAVEAIAYPYQFIAYALRDGYLETWVEQRAGESLTRLGPGRDLRARRLPGGLMFSAPVILDLDLPGGRRYQAAEHYDFVAPKDGSSDFRISWVRFGDLPSFAGPGKAFTHLVSWRVESYEDLPASIRDYVEAEAPLWREPPVDIEEIRRLQAGPND